MTAEPFTRPWLRDMALRSLTEPRAAAAELLSLSIPRDVLWTWLALLSVLNGVLYWSTLPAQVEVGVMVPAFMHSPILLTLGLAGLMILMTQFLVLAGRVLGGSGDFFRMLQITCWLQSLRLVFQMAVVIVTTIAPGIGAIMAVVGGIWGIFVLVNFLTEAHRFGTPLKAVATMVFAMLASAFALSFILAILGVTPEGAL
ncbi:hypothetical protein ATO6_16885 [Oceanicola sp. 22II-s10i]|uniref:Yip1 family protein n=1 Tax=Oceanicola sp. 22II-s10i TaxID=1317116 RepID=UPI000B51F0E1|nr:Yip1 family protein [Oceanicola sp. 22II-s10i]OWU83556.1 hypothetical protein ATO6_16885 [Oceanicola sp. 22II-s10i]